MKINTSVFSLKGFSLNDKGLLAAFLSVLTGLISGSLVYVLVIHKNNNPIIDMFITFNTEFVEKSDIEVFLGIAISVLIYYIALFISGSSFLGRTICIVATIFKSAGISAMISYLYTVYGLIGLEYVLLVFFPGKLILIPAAVLMTKCSFDMSHTVKSGLNEKGSVPSIVKIYYLKSLIFLLIFIISATVDLFTLKIFSNLFDFS